MYQCIFPRSFSSWVIYFPWEPQVLNYCMAGAASRPAASLAGLQNQIAPCSDISTVCQWVCCSPKNWCSWDTRRFGGLGMHWRRYKPSRVHCQWQCDNGRTEHRAGEIPGLTQALGTVLELVQCLFALCWSFGSAVALRAAGAAPITLFCSLCHAPL